MNPLTNMKNQQKMNERELALGMTGTRSSWHSQYDDSAWVFVGGLPYDLTEGDVVCIFSQYGEIVNINLVRDKDTGKSKGFAFICYEDQRSTILAVDNLNGAKVLNRAIRVDHKHNYQVPKEHGDEDEITMKLREQGCAPGSALLAASEAGPEADSDLLPMDDHMKKKKKKKKDKKDKKKKKDKKNKKHKKHSDSSSDFGDGTDLKPMKGVTIKQEPLDTEQNFLPTRIKHERTESLTNSRSAGDNVDRKSFREGENVSSWMQDKQDVSPNVENGQRRSEPSSHYYKQTRPTVVDHKTDCELAEKERRRTMMEPRVGRSEEGSQDRSHGDIASSTAQSGERYSNKERFSRDERCNERRGGREQSRNDRDCKRSRERSPMENDQRKYRRETVVEEENKTHERSKDGHQVESLAHHRGISLNIRHPSKSSPPLPISGKSVDSGNRRRRHDSSSSPEIRHQQQSGSETSQLSTERRQSEREHRNVEKIDRAAAGRTSHHEHHRDRRR